VTIAIVGRGMMGNRLSQLIPDSILVDVDITNRQSMLNIFEAIKPSAVINAAGKTGRPNVDWCETHQEETYRSNVVGPLTLAGVCKDVGSYMLHIGSGCIFYGPSLTPGGWREYDFANPISYYSKTKYAADLALSGLPHVGIARIRMPIDSIPGPRNLITKLLGYNQIVDVDNSVTVVQDFADVSKKLIEHHAQGIFHVTNPGLMRHSQLLNLYKEHIDSTIIYKLISEDELMSSGLVAAKRSNCQLSTSRLERLGIHMRPVNEALKDCILQYAGILKGKDAR
jgi:dTDP-4-dehydrorhamnose reductase